MTKVIETIEIDQEHLDYMKDCMIDNVDVSTQITRMINRAKASEINNLQSMINHVEKIKKDYTKAIEQTRKDNKINVLKFDELQDEDIIERRKPVKDPRSIHANLSSKEIRQAKVEAMRNKFSELNGTDDTWTLSMSGNCDSIITHLCQELDMTPDDVVNKALKDYYNNYKIRSM